LDEIQSPPLEQGREESGVVRSVWFVVELHQNVLDTILDRCYPKIPISDFLSPYPLTLTALWKRQFCW
jgi:hypothetical protein